MSESAVPREKKQANVIGARFYCTGRPCLRGHVGLRLASTGNCCQCNSDRGRAAYAAHPQAYAQYYATWKKKHPERYLELNREGQRRHYAKRRSLEQSGGTYTSGELNEIRTLQRNKCAYCRRRLRLSMTHIDHIMPLSKGGSNTKINLQLLCANCNLRKHAKDPLRFAQEMGFLV